MSATSLCSPQHEPPPLSPFEGAFIRTVLEHRGILARPTDNDITAAVEVLRRYDEQCVEDPGGGSWEPTMRDEESQAELRAKAFIMFGATKPTPAQWQKAHTALFGPMPCSACE
jgi:hypothetical protein